MGQARPFTPPPMTLREHAADALRRARQLPIGSARNDLRQLAIGLRCLELRQAQTFPAYRTAFDDLIDVPPGEAPLAPL